MSNDRELRTAVIKASGLHYYESLLIVWFNADRIEQKIVDQVGLAKEATLHYDKVNNVVIDVKEYRTVGYIYRNGKYYRLGTNGVPLTVGESTVTESCPVFYNFKNEQKLKQAVVEISELSSKLQHAVSEVHYEPSKVNPNKVRLYMNDGNEVIADLTTLNKKMKYYPTIATKMEQKGTVDLEVGAFSYPNK